MFLVGRRRASRADGDLGEQRARTSRSTRLQLADWARITERPKGSPCASPRARPGASRHTWNRTATVTSNQGTYDSATRVSPGSSPRAAAYPPPPPPPLPPPAPAAASSPLPDPSTIGCPLACFVLVANTPNTADSMKPFAPPFAMRSVSFLRSGRRVLSACVSRSACVS